jgi:hypothetical protein
MRLFKASDFHSIVHNSMIPRGFMSFDIMRTPHQDFVTISTHRIQARIAVPMESNMESKMSCRSSMNELAM